MIDRLDILAFMDALLGERPADGAVDDAVVTAMSNSRFGYALRNRETQLLGAGDYVARDDPLAVLLEERWGAGGPASTRLSCSASSATSAPCICSEAPTSSSR